MKGQRKFRNRWLGAKSTLFPFVSMFLETDRGSDFYGLAGWIWLMDPHLRSPDVELALLGVASGCGIGGKKQCSV